MKTAEEFQQAAALLLKLVEDYEKGLISEHQLLSAWKKFMRDGQKYLNQLHQEIKLN